MAHIDTICLDKTGTITQGKMKVSEVKLYKENTMPKPFNEMMQAFVNGMDDSNSTFIAMKEYFKGNTILDKVDKVPFSSERKWSAISFRNEGSIVLGAPERLFEKSNETMPSRVIDLQKDGKRVLSVAYTKK